MHFCMSKHLPIEPIGMYRESITSVTCKPWTSPPDPISLIESFHLEPYKLNILPIRPSRAMLCRRWMPILYKPTWSEGIQFAPKRTEENWLNWFVVHQPHQHYSELVEIPSYQGLRHLWGTSKCHRSSLTSPTWRCISRGWGQQLPVTKGALLWRFIDFREVEWNEK